jgi:hypothetical protein
MTAPAMTTMALATTAADVAGEDMSENNRVNHYQT